MNIPQPLIAAYAQLEPILEEVETRVTQSLRPYSQNNLLPFISRRKTIESVAEKIETGRYQSFSDIDDLVAVTLVVPNLLHEAGAIAHCEKIFDVLDARSRGQAKKPPNVFRFDTTRLYARLISPEGSDIGEGISIFDVKFELQIRTAFEHAWIVATHALTYKSDDVDWKKLRLAAQMKAASEQLDLLVTQFDTLASAMDEPPWPETRQKVEIAQLISTLLSQRIIPMESAPKDMSRFADNLLSLGKASKKKFDITSAIAVLETGLREYSEDSFPRSASLLQICMGILCRDGVLSGPLQKYTCHVTDNLKQLFPATRSLTPVFRYDRS